MVVVDRQLRLAIGVGFKVSQGTIRSYTVGPQGLQGSVMVLRCGQASRGAVGLLWMMHVAGITAKPIFDVLHHQWNEAPHACNNSNMWRSIGLTVSVLNVSHGPWMGRRLVHRLGRDGG